MRPAVLEAVRQPPERVVVGTTLDPPPAFVVRGADGRVLGGVRVTVTVTEGEGVLRDAPLRSRPGPTSVGQWMVGIAAGAASITVRAGSLPPLVFRVHVDPGVPEGIGVVSGGDQTGFAGDLLPDPIVVKVYDRFGNGVAGVPITVAVAEGGGTVTPAYGVTGSDGTFGGISWRLGRLGGSQSLAIASGVTGSGGSTFSSFTGTVVARIRSQYDAEMRFFGPDPQAAIALTFQRAMDRVRAAVVSDLDDVTLLNFDMGRCGLPGVVLNEVVDDVLIFASVTPIDGQGRVLASAGPCITRVASRFTVVGVMRFDVDDLNVLLATDRLYAVVLHEILHIAGVGTLWRGHGLLAGSGTSDPRFTGLLAAARCVAAGGGTVCASGSVPVENSGGSGTIEAHWREAIFDSELMTGFVEATPAMPFSTITLASLEDLGLTVNYMTADPYTVPAAPLVSPRLAQPLLGTWEVLELPRFEVTRAGKILPLERR